MQMTRGVFLIANLVLALCLTGSAAQEQEVAGEPEIPTAKLVDTMRLLNNCRGVLQRRNRSLRPSGGAACFFSPTGFAGQISLRSRKPCAL